MGISIEQWRAVVGCFSQPARTKTRLKLLNIRYGAHLSLSIRLLLFALLTVAGIESNPGPATGTTGNRGRGAARGSGPPRGRGSGRGSGRVDYFANYPTSSQDTYSLRSRSQRLQEQPSRPPLSQASLNAWLRAPQQTQVEQEPPASGGESESDTDPNDLNVENLSNPSNMTDLLLEIRSDVKRMNSKFDKLDKKVQDLKKDNKYLKQQNESLSQQVNELTTTVMNLETRMNDAEKRNEQLEAQSRRENLKFYGFEDDQSETWEQSENKVRSYISNELNMDEQSIKIERAHRLFSKTSPRPIIVKFSYFKDKELVLKSYREKRKAQQDSDQIGDVEGGADENAQRPVRVSEDFPVRVTKARTNLYPFMKSAQDNEKEAYLRYDKLVVEGQAYVFDNDRGRPVPAKHM